MLTKSPLRYPGGKSKALNFLADFVPADTKTICEPFMGGTSFTIWALQNLDLSDSVQYISDINPHLVLFWQVLYLEPTSLIEKIYDYYYSYPKVASLIKRNRYNTYNEIHKDYEHEARANLDIANQSSSTVGRVLYDHIKTKLRALADDKLADLALKLESNISRLNSHKSGFRSKNPIKAESELNLANTINYQDNSDHDDNLSTELSLIDEETITLAADFFVLNRITFSGLLEAGGYSEQAFQKRFTKSSIDRLYKLVKLFEHHSLVIRHLSYEQAIAQLDHDPASTLIFLDPPYYSATPSKLYGRQGKLHTCFEHEQLADILSKSPYKFLLTYDDHEYIADLYPDFKITKWQLTYAMNSFKRAKTTTGNELLIQNFELQ